MIFFTSDLHLGHQNVIRFCQRPFDTAKEMDAALIANWNARVTNADTVYILGDLIFRAEEPADTYLRQLKGKKHLIIGNHDRTWLDKGDYSTYFESISRMDVINMPQGKCTLCHYPMMSFEGRYLIYGHIHNNRSDTYWPLLKTMDHALNAGVEVNGYRPVSFDELVANNAAFRAAPVLLED